MNKDYVTKTLTDYAVSKENIWELVAGLIAKLDRINSDLLQDRSFSFSDFLEEFPPLHHEVVDIDVGYDCVSIKTEYFEPWEDWGDEGSNYTIPTKWFTETEEEIKAQMVEYAKNSFKQAKERGIKQAIDDLEYWEGLL